MTVTCAIRYVIDPFKHDQFETYARNWLKIIPACGGDLLGYFMPHEGTNNIAHALISFESWRPTRPRGHAEGRQGRQGQFPLRRNRAIHPRRGTHLAAPVDGRLSPRLTAAPLPADCS